MKVPKGVHSHGVVSSFRAEISSFRVAGFIFSSFRMTLLRLFVFSHGVFLWGFFVLFFSVASFRHEKKKKQNGTIQQPLFRAYVHL